MTRLWIEIAFICVISYAAYHCFNWSVDKSSIRGKRILITVGSQNIGEEIAYHIATRESSSISGLDMLVLNHAIAWNGPWNGSKEELDVVKKSTVTNYWSFVGMATAAKPLLKASKGQIIIVASQAGQPALPDFAAYGASKAAVINFFSSLQVEQMRYGDPYPSITICIIGIVDTQEARNFAERSKIKVPRYPISATASDIIDGGLRKDRYVYVPWFLGLFRPLREISPSFHDKLLLLVMFE